MAEPSLPEIVTALISPDRHWPGPDITFSIPRAGSTWEGYPNLGSGWREYWGNEQLDPGLGYLSPAQAEVFRGAIAAWDRLIAPHLIETDDLTNPGDIRVAFRGSTSTLSYVYGPDTPNQIPDVMFGDIWLGGGLKAKTLKLGWDIQNGDSPTPLLLQEIAHALGLKFTRETPGLPTAYDDQRYTLMTSGQPSEVETLSFSLMNGDPQLMTHGERVLPDGPMVMDIAAIQAIYGADPDTNAGATRYDWAIDKPFLTSIYDAGGIDTIDLAAHHRPSLVDLTPGAYSSIDIYTRAQQQAEWVAKIPERADEIAKQYDNDDAHNLLYTGHDNLGIAYSTVIENANGGSGDDTLIGNTANNTLRGNAGDDSIQGAAGDDRIEGGPGHNILRGGDGSDLIQGGSGFDDTNGNMGADTVLGGQGADWVVGGKDNDLLNGDDGDDIVYGNQGDDWCDGGAGADIVRGGQGDDVLFGQGGDDWLAGDLGNDTMAGGPGADTFYSANGAGADRILDFSRAEGDRIQLDAGMTWQAAQVGADTVVTFGGGQLTLVGVQLVSLTGTWIFAG